MHGRGDGGMCGWGHVCVAGGHAWKRHACMHGREVCVAWGCTWQRACMAGGACAHGRGHVCVAGGCMAGGMHGSRDVWQGGMHCMECVAGGMHGSGCAWQEACVAGEMATAAGSMHPTRMHSCLFCAPEAYLVTSVKKLTRVFRQSLKTPQTSTADIR